MTTLNKKRQYKYGLLLSVIIGIISVFLLYSINYSRIKMALVSYEGGLQVILVVSLRIFILLVITFYLFNKWFKQEAQYLTDIPFLLGLFFMLLTFGKFIDLFTHLIYFTLNDDLNLLVVKLRFFLIIFEVAPLIYLGFEVIFFRLEDKFTKLKDKKFMDTFRTRLILLIVGVESVVIILGPTFRIVAMMLPFILIPSLAGIVYIFYLAHRLNRLNVVKPKILTIGFLLYMISNIFRPLMQNILGETATYVIVVEIVDICIFLVIFLGLYKK